MDHQGTIRSTSSNITHWGIDIFVFGFDVGTMRNQESHHLIISDGAIAAISGKVKWCFAEQNIASIDVGTRIYN